jgi:hypothetical protein
VIGRIQQYQKPAATNDGAAGGETDANGFNGGDYGDDVELLRLRLSMAEGGDE